MTTKSQTVKHHTTWICVLDGAQVRFFTLHRGESGQVFEAIGAPLVMRRQDGRGRAPGAMADPETVVRMAADRLDRAYGQNAYRHLVLVAPPRLLAKLRAQLADRTAAAIVHEVPKNLSHLAIDRLWHTLSALLLMAARPVLASEGISVSDTSENLPVTVVFRNMTASVAAQNTALKLAAKLGKRFGRILNCRVTVEAPKHGYRKVKEFRVAVDMKLPGRAIACKAVPGHGASPDDLGAAMRAAFDAASRQLQDYAERIKTHMRTPRQTVMRMRAA